MHIAVVGAGWSGLAAAVEATARGHAVSLYEMAAAPGGRARRVESGGLALDNGQHILIGAYTETLRLMSHVGVAPERVLLRTPLVLPFADGTALKLPSGPPALAFARAVLSRKGWRWRERVALLGVAGGWARAGFRCDERMTVDQLATHLPPRIRADLIDPLCIAALNTPAHLASASVFLRVLRDALFSGRGSADLLLPRVDLGALWPDAAVSWLVARGTKVRLSHRVGSIESDDRDAASPHVGWRVDGEHFDAVVLAASNVEAARLARSFAPNWADCTEALRHEPITTVVLCGPGTRLAHPMLALRESAGAPAQFVFDLGQLRGMDGVLAFVISGASAWAAKGNEATSSAVLAQAGAALAHRAKSPFELVRVFTEKRATFLCTPGLQRPTQRIAKGLVAAGDYVAGPYPATLEGAVRSGVGAIEGLENEGSIGAARP
jgi:squalene-associated FAD-dependent desaturase